VCLAQPRFTFYLIVGARRSELRNASQPTSASPQPFSLSTVAAVTFQTQRSGENFQIRLPDFGWNLAFRRTASVPPIFCQPGSLTKTFSVPLHNSQSCWSGASSLHPKVLDCALHLQPGTHLTRAWDSDTLTLSFHVWTFTTTEYSQILPNPLIDIQTWLWTPTHTARTGRHWSNFAKDQLIDKWSDIWQKRPLMSSDVKSLKSFPPAICPRRLLQHLPPPTRTFHSHGYLHWKPLSPQLSTGLLCRSRL